MHPNGAPIAQFQEMRRNGSKPLAQTGPVFSVAQHLQQPVGQRQDEKYREQRTVERVHE
jgi:hypothetical protein